jgi:tRNA A58 N-methylase Trm61
MITISNNIYLKALGLVTQSNQLMPSMQAKFKQINKYIETIDSVIKNSSLADQTEIHIADMGAGKGYLTFALYDYLNQVLKLKAHVAGMELRPELVKMGNELAQKCAFERLKFYEGEIKSYALEKIDMLIALHACDTATDDAIAQGIAARAAVIITAPCCHKQIRKAMNVTNALKPITQFGILEERQAEIVTDTLRALMLEAHGYKTQVFEFISDAHTHKNVMIVGVKKGEQQIALDQYREKIAALKKMFGIEEFYLEQRLV